jgi:sporulation protein YlmC with PRC-barrel domain
MRIRYYEMIGKPVIAADGTHVGRVTDLVAEREGAALCVTTLVLGPAGLARRISFRRAAIFRVAPPRVIPWADVARVEEAIHLRPESRGPRPAPPDTIA